MFRFSIRDVLWLTVVVGLGIGWWLDHRRINVQEERWKHVNEMNEARLNWQWERQQAAANSTLGSPEDSK